MSMEVFTWGGEAGDVQAEEIDDAYSDLVTLQGDGNSFPVQTDNSPPMLSTPVQLLGSIGTTARDLGTAVGKVQHDLASAGKDFRTARANTASGNSLGTWWQYASQTDKLLVGLAVAALVVAIVKA